MLSLFAWLTLAVVAGCLAIVNRKLLDHIARLQKRDGDTTVEYIQNKEEFYRYLFQNCHCINAGQSPEERRNKYRFCRLLGFLPATARMLRDRRPNSIAKYFGYHTFLEMLADMEKRLGVQDGK